jgi:hypothetical protein
MANVHVLDHPLIQHKLAILRNKETGTKEFRALINEIAGLMCYEATRNLPTVEVAVETPITTAKCRMLAGKKLAIVPILRAGLGMVDAMVDMIPSAKIGHIGLYRDPETHEPVEYYCKLPEDVDKRLDWALPQQLVRRLQGQFPHAGGAAAAVGGIGIITVVEEILPRQHPPQMAQYADTAHTGVEYRNILFAHRPPPFYRVIWAAYFVPKMRSPASPRPGMM